MLQANKIIMNLDANHFSGEEAPVSNELLLFDIIYHYLIPIASPTIETKSPVIINKKEAYPIILHAETGALASKICKAYADIKSYVDKNGMHTLKFEEISQAEGHSLNTKEIIYDQEKHIMTFEGQKRMIPENTQDPLSLFIYLRTLFYQDNVHYKTYINSNQENYLVETHIKERKFFETQKGKIALWKLRIRVSSQKDYSKSRCTIDVWVTDTRAKYPVLIKVHTLAGTIIAVLRNIK